MNVLLDTHAFLWWIADDPRLSSRARETVADDATEVLLSAASAWEIAIKASIGRVELPEDPATFVPAQLEANAFAVLPIHLRHALHVASLPDHHSDPFDRMLVAQAQLEELTIVTSDEQIARYDVRVIA